MGARLCRETGALSELPLALNSRALMLEFAGDLVGAASLVEEVRAVTEAAGIHAGRYGAMGLAALHGNEVEASALIDSSVADASLRGQGSSLASAEWANAVLCNGLGRYEDAMPGARRASEDRT